MKNLIILIAVFVYGVADAQPVNLSPAQKKAVADMSTEAYAGCMKGAKEVSSLKHPPGFPEWAKITLKYQSDPAFCRCVQRKLVDSFTPAFFQLSQQQKQMHVLNVMKDMECSVASIKNYFSQSCTGFVEGSIDPDRKGVRLNELAKKRGNPDTRSLTASICACMRDKISPITATQWMERTSAAFAPRPDGKVSGPPKQIGKTPLEQAFSECTL